MNKEIEDALIRLQKAKERRTARQMYILCYDDIDLYMSALRLMRELGIERTCL